MRRSALLTIALVIAVGISEAGIASAQPFPQSSAPVSAPPPAPDDTTRPMTPRQIAEQRGDIAMARKEYEKAVSAYQELVLSEPKNAVLLNKIGIAYQQLGDLDQAERAYKKAMQANKRSPNPVNNLGSLEYSRRRYGKAIKYYKKALSIDANVATFYGNLGYAYSATNQYPKAMDAFVKALTLDPDVLTRRSPFGSVIQPRSSPDIGTLNFMIAKSYAKTGDAEHAAHYLKLARDGGYKDFLAAQKDPDFALVIKDPRVQDVLKLQPAYAGEPENTPPN